MRSHYHSTVPIRTVLTAATQTGPGVRRSPALPSDIMHPRFRQRGLGFDSPAAG